MKLKIVSQAQVYTSTVQHDLKGHNSRFSWATKPYKKLGLVHETIHFFFVKPFLKFHSIEYDNL